MMNGAYAGIALKCRSLLLVLAAGLLLSGCFGGGGGGGNGSDSGDDFDNAGAASVGSSEDAAAAAYAVTEGTYQAINSETSRNSGLPVAAVVSELGLEETLVEDMQRISEEADYFSASPTAATFDFDGTCGGNVVYDTGDDQNQPTNGEVSYVYNYNNYCVSLSDGGQYVIDGVAEYNATFDEGQLVSYSVTWDLTSTLDNGQTVASSLNGTTTCTFEQQVFSCDYSEDFVGPNGESYRVENVSVNEDSNGNYGVSARVYDTNLGYVDFEASDINNDCENGNFSGGTITITDASGDVVVEVEFSNNCNDCIVTFNNVSEVYDQPDRT